MWLLPRSMVDIGLWASLNFATACQVKRWAKRRELEVRFDRGVLADSLGRFISDPVFAQRHGRLGAIVGLLRRIGLVGLVRLLPPRLVSPMRFTVKAAPNERSG